MQSGTKLWPICDGLGSVYAWVDRSGSVRDSYSYDVYGARTQTSGTVSVAWGYTGREHDADTGLNYNRDRYLAPGLATWTQPDALGFVDGPNHYSYVILNPARATDPSGNEAGALDTFDAWAVFHPDEFFAWAADELGISGATPIATSTASNVTLGQLLGLAGTVCATVAYQNYQQDYFRGLSKQDYLEFRLFGMVLSKGARASMDITTALAFAVMNNVVARHQDKNDTFMGNFTPFISTTKRVAVAQAYANSGPNASGVVIRFKTYRPPIPTSLNPDDAEYLFFFLLGFKGETLERVYC